MYVGCMLYMYICGTPGTYLFYTFIGFHWYLLGFVTDLHCWSLAVVSRGGTIHMYVYI